MQSILTPVEFKIDPRSTSTMSPEKVLKMVCLDPDLPKNLRAFPSATCSEIAENWISDEINQCLKYWQSRAISKDAFIARYKWRLIEYQSFLQKMLTTEDPYLYTLPPEHRFEPSLMLKAATSTATESCEDLKAYSHSHSKDHDPADSLRWAEQIQVLLYSAIADSTRHIETAKKQRKKLEEGRGDDPAEALPYELAEEDVRRLWGQELNLSKLRFIEVSHQLASLIYLDAIQTIPKKTVPLLKSARNSLAS